MKAEGSIRCLYGLLVCLLPLHSAGLGQTKDRARAEVDFVFCGKAATLQPKAGLENHESLAAAICSGSSRLTSGQVKPSELIPLLRDRREIFVDDDGTAVTVREMAFTMLEDADIVKLPFKKYSNKLICGCEIKGEWNRVHVLTLTDENFETVIKIVQQAARAQSVVRRH